MFIRPWLESFKSLWMPSNRLNKRRAVDHKPIKTQVESLEEKTLLAAFDLVTVIPNQGVFLNNGQTLNEAPQEVTLRFSPGQSIVATSIAGAISITRAGVDDTFGTMDDAAVPIGYIGPGDQPNEIIVRFAQNLPDNQYRIDILGTASGGLAAVSNDPFLTRDFTFNLDLGAQVEAVVPQPVIRSQVINVTNSAALTNGALVTITNGSATTILELRSSGAAALGNILVDSNGGDAAVAANIAAAINGLGLPPTVALTAGVVGNTVTVTGSAFEPVVSFGTGTTGAFTRGTGTLAQLTDKVVVYFNQDQLNLASAENPAFYRLIDAATGTVQLPAIVNYQYNSVTGLSTAVLTFPTALVDASYNLKVGVSSEPNGAPAEAIQVGTIFNSQAFVTNEYLGDGTGSSTDGTDNDLYQFTLVSSGTVTFTLDPVAPLDGVLEFLDSFGTVIATEDTALGGGSETLVTGVLGAETFYVRVSSKSDLTTGGYKLTINATGGVNGSDDNSSFGTATNLGNLGAGGLFTSALIQPQGAFVIMPQLPGGADEPGHRQLPFGPFSGLSSAEIYHGTGTAGDPSAPGGIFEQTYSFPVNYDGGSLGTLLNQITEEQKQIIRQIFQIYSYEAGIQFYEVAAGGAQQIVVGDMRAVLPTLTPPGPSGVSGTPILLNAAIFANDNTFGGGFTGTAFHEIGHNLGLGHSYDVPSIQGSGLAGEPIFIGDNDLVHLLRVHPNNSSDIDLYQFNVTETGVLSAETIAERLGASNLLNSVLTLYRQDGATRTVVARNDDFFSKDSGLEVPVTPGTYFIGVTSTGNDNYDPSISNSGFGGRSQGAYQLKLEFKRAAMPVNGLQDLTGQLLDGDHDGQAGGEYNTWFKVAPTIIVDKLAPAGGSGSLAAPYQTIGEALTASVGTSSIVRIVGNGGADGDASTLGDNVPYTIGRDYNASQTPLADGATFQVPQNVTVMIDAGALLKVRGQTIDVGTSSPGTDRSQGALQVLGTPVNNVTFTSWRDDDKGSIDDTTNGAAAGADWGGIIFRQDSDSTITGVFLNTVNHATLQYGGGSVSVDGGQLRVYTVIEIETTRPTITNNIIQNNADAAVSANPDSFKADDGRIGPDIHGNLITQNSTNGLFIRIATPFGAGFESLNVIARFDDTDITHAITQNLILNGRPAGALSNPVSARLMIDPGVIVKLSGARIETAMGNSNLIAEGTTENPIRFTSQQDDKFGAGGTFDLKGDGFGANAQPAPGYWSGIFVGQTSTASLDHVSITYAGGTSEIGGDSDNFNPIETLQGRLRVTNSVFENNAGGQAMNLVNTNNRDGRGGNDSSTIFVRGAQPVLINNVFRDNVGNVVSINANSLQAVVKPDYGRSTGLVDDFEEYDDNYGPLVRQNRFANSTTFTSTSTLGMNIRAEELTTESIWDDTDIAHVVRGTIVSSEFHTYGGLTLQSSSAGSLIVKLEGASAGFLATGDPLEITDRIGGTVQVIGQPGFPVILTSLRDDNVSAGYKPDGFPQYDTNGDNNAGGASVGSPGDWNSLTFNQSSNDTNVAIVLESEPALTHGNDINFALGNPQSLGNLAPNLNSGDENRRLGFEVHGFISPDTPGDVDVYSFTANAGTEVWIDTDFTSQRLDVMVELLNSSNTVVARSLNSQAEEANPAAWLASGYAGTLAAGATVGNSNLNPLTKDRTLGNDFYTSNFHDAGFRAVLPGTPGSLITYFVRVRSQPALITDPVDSGLTSGAYQLQVRLKQIDDIPGSTVRYADIRYATNGIETIGLPAHSPLMGESAEQTGDNTAPLGGQYLGPLLQTDRNTLSVSGNLDASTDVDFYRFTVDYTQIQVAIPGPKFFPTVFDIDWTDGLTRPDTMIAVYNSNRDLIYIGRESDIADDQPAPTQGQDLDDLSRASLGRLDPFIGSVNLIASANQGTTVASPTTYYVAVFSNGDLPSALTANFNSSAADATQRVRLEPINSIKRIVEDHIGFTGYKSQETDVLPTTGPLFDIATTVSLAANVRPFTLSDVNLFVTTAGGLRIVDPFNGRTEITYGNYAGGLQTVQDIDMRSDGTLWGVRYTGNLPRNGVLVQLNTGTSADLSSVTDGIIDVDTDGATERFQSNNAANDALAWHRAGVGNYDYLYYATQQSDDYPDPPIVDPDPPNLTGVSKLYRAQPNGNAAWVANQFGASGIITDAAATITTRTTGLQFLNNTLWGVSAAGQLYPIRAFGVQNPIAGDSGTNIGNPDSSNDPVATATSPPRLVTGTILDFSPFLNLGEGFAGITDAPQNVENQSYADFLFIITTSGRIICVDPTAGSAAGALQTVFDTNNNNLADSAFLNTGITSATGLAFSPVDYNLWHPTVTRNSDPGHGVTNTSGASVDNSRNPNAEPRNVTGGVWTLLTSGEDQGGASMHFGIENYTDSLTYFSYGNQGQLGVLDNGAVSQQDLTSNPNIRDNYNAPGGTAGSLVSNSFSLVGYTASDKPTLYFNYWLETENAIGNQPDSMRDSARVYVSTDNGLTWTLAATNNSMLSAADTPDAELPAYLSTNRNASTKSNQGVQELYETSSWRQARIDLNDFVGASQIKLRFDFSTWGRSGTVVNPATGLRVVSDDTSNPTFVNDTGSSFGVTRNSSNSPLAAQNNTSEGFYIDDIIVGFASRGEMVTASAGQGAGFTDLTASARTKDPDPMATQQLLSGNYQLEIRRGENYANLVDPPTPEGFVIVNPTLDVNDRQTNGQTVRLGTNATAGDTVTIYDGLITQVFQFGAGPGQVAIGASVGTTALNLQNAINTAFAGRNSVIAKAVSSTTNSDRVDIFGAALVTEVGTLSVQSYVRQGDDNLERTQGQFIIENNTILNSANVGIMVNDNVRVGSVPHPGAVSNTPVSSAERVVTGMYIQNNVIANFGQAGIDINGDANVNLGLAVTPFVKVVNNTIVGDTSQVASNLLALNAANVTGAMQAIAFDEPGYLVGDTDPIYNFTAVPGIGDVTVSFGGYFLGQSVTSGGTISTFNDSTPDSPLQLDPNAPPTSIEDDPSSATTPVLSGSPTFNGPISVLFSLPVAAVALDGGDFDAIGSLSIEAFDVNGNSLGLVSNSKVGVETLGLAVADGLNLIAGISFYVTGNESANFSLDNLRFGDVASIVQPTPVGTGVSVRNRATATLMNNAFVRTAVAVAIDPTYQTSVLEANLYQGNLSNGTSVGINALQVAPTVELFVDPHDNNFYPAFGSPLIDSSRSTFNDRATYTTVAGALGIPASPIIAPLFDRFGQLRVDDAQPGPPNQPGLGQNPFQDRGAIERADNDGGTVVPTFPEDNDGAGIDLYPAIEAVIWIDSGNLNNPAGLFNPLTTFRLQLIDSGSGIDDQSVNSSDFLLLENGVPLVEGQDYIFTYNQNSNECIFTSISTFKLARYEIIIANPTQGNPATPFSGITDLAGNLLQNNHNTATPIAGVPSGTDFKTSLLFFTYIITNGQNDAPVNSFDGTALPDAPTTGPTVITNEDIPVVFSPTNGNAITVTDPDAFLAQDGDPSLGEGGGRIEATVSVLPGYGPDGLADAARYGSLNLTNNAALVQLLNNGGTITPTGTPIYEFLLTGAIDDINAVLDGLEFSPEPDFPGALPGRTVQLQIVTNDLGKFGPGASPAILTTSIVPIQINPVNDAPTLDPIADQPLVAGTLLEDDGQQTVNLTGITSGPANENYQTLSVSASITSGNLNLVNNFIASVVDAFGNATLSYTPVADEFGTATVTVRVTDSGPNGGINGDVNFFEQTFTITVTPVNDAPTLNPIADQPLVAGSLLEDAAQQTVNLSGITAGPVNESTQTLTITAAITGGNPNLVNNFLGGAVDAFGNATLNYTPVLNEFGTATVTVTVTDNGPNGGANGDVNFTTRTFTITVTPVNDAPTLDLVPNQPVVAGSLLEDDGQQTINLTGITPGPTNETTILNQTVAVAVALTGGNLNLVNNLVASAVVGGTATINYTPVLNEFGTVQVTVTVTDSGPNGGANGDVNVYTQTFTITVTGVNDAPTLDPIADQPLVAGSLLEDAGQQTVNLSGITAGPPNESSQTLTVTASITGGNPNLVNNFIGSAVVGGEATLRYTPVANEFGTATVTVRVTDSGANGGANGDVNFTEESFTITVTPVNDAPTLGVIANQPASGLILEDAPQQTVNLTGITAGPPNESAQTLTVTAAITGGNPNLVTNFIGSAVVGGTATLNYTPVLNEFGTATVTVTVTDNGPNGGANGDVNFTTRTFTITVTPVNDAPTLTFIPDQPVSGLVLEDAGQQTVNLSGITSGPPNESAQTVVATATVTGGNLGLISNLSVSSVSGSGTATLNYTPLPNQFGTTMVTVRVADNGPNGGANGDVNFFLQTFTITVTPVNDPPTLNPIANQPVSGLLLEDAGQQTINLSGITAGPANETGQVLTVTAAVTGGNLNLVNNFIGSAVVGGAATLSYTPVPNQFGSATVTVTVTDDGPNGVNGAINFFTRTFTVVVAPVNDAPTLDPIPDQPVSGLVLEDAGQQTINLTGVTAGPANENAQALTVTAAITGGNPNLVNNLVGSAVVGGLAALSYTPVANEFGTATITVRVTDSGLNGGANGDVNFIERTFTITVTPVNDPPTLNPITNQPVSGQLLEDAPQQTVNLSGITAGPANETGQTMTVTAAVTGGNLNLVNNLIASAVSGSGLATLSYTPVANQFGTATVTVTVTDSGANGGANGDINFSTRTFTITITPVNDQPTIAAISNQVVNEDAGPLSIGLNGISVGMANESPPQTLSFTLSSDNPTLIPNDPDHLSVVYTQGNTTGQLLFMSATDVFGVANITLTMRDSGGTLNGGVDTVVRTFQVTVNQVSDAPADILLSGNQVFENQPPGTLVGMLSTQDVDLPDDNFTYSIVGGTAPGFFQIVGNQLQTLLPLDYDPPATNDYTVGIRSTDRFGLSFTKTFNIDVLNLNDAPTLNTPTPVIFNEDPGSPVLINLTGISAGVGELQTLTVTATSDNPNLFLNSLPVTYTSPGTAATLSLMPLTNASGTATITVTVKDNGGTANGGIDTITRTFNVMVNPVNDNPTNINLTNNTIQEIPAGTTAANVLVGQLSSTDPDNPAAGNTFAYALVDGAGADDNTRFSIVNDQLFAMGPIDFDTKPNYSVRIRSTDNGSPALTFDKVFTIQSTNVNEPATGIGTAANAITGLLNSIPENQPAGSVVGALLATDPDAGDSATFTLVAGAGATDNARFEIVGGNLVAKAGFDFETKSTYTVRIRTVDSQGLAFETPVEITISDVNEVPLQITLSNNVVPENISIGATVGALLTQDVDNPESFTYSLVGGTGSADNGRFSISGDQLIVNMALDYEERSNHSYSVRVRSTDMGGLSFERVFTIVVTDVNEVPTNLTLSSATLGENLPLGSNVGTLTPVDPDFNDAYSFALVSGVGSDDNASFNLMGNKLVSAATFDFETKSSYTVRIRATDSAGHPIERQFTISISDKKDAPVVSLANTTLTGRKAVVVDSAATITDIDSPNFDGGMLKVYIQSGEQTGDTLGFKDDDKTDGLKLKAARGKTVLLLNRQEIATISGGVRGIPLEIRFGNGISQDLFQRIMRGITLKSKPFAAPRQVAMQAFDETGLASNIAIRNIIVN